MTDGTKEVLDFMLDTRTNQMGLDTWGSPNSLRTKHFMALPDKTTTILKYRGYEFFLNYSSGGGAGMGAYPPIKKIFILHKFGE